MITYTPIRRFNLTIATSPKCGCQTMSRIIRRIFKHPFYPTYQCGLPTENKELRKLQTKKFLAVLDSVKGDLVLASRNPIKRVVSCYNYMIAGNHHYTSLPSTLKWFKEPIESSLNKNLFDISLTEFINYIHDTPDHLRDIHFATQSFLVEDIDFDKIINVETFGTDMQGIISEYGLPVCMPAHIQKNKTNYIKINPEEITQNLIDKIYAIYAKDFSKFGHTKLSVPEVKKYLADKSLLGPVHQGAHASKFKTWRAPA